MSCTEDGEEAALIMMTMMNNGNGCHLPAFCRLNFFVALILKRRKFNDDNKRGTTEQTPTTDSTGYTAPHYILYHFSAIFVVNTCEWGLSSVSRIRVVTLWVNSPLAWGLVLATTTSTALVVTGWLAGWRGLTAFPFSLTWRLSFSRFFSRTQLLHLQTFFHYCS